MGKGHDEVGLMHTLPAVSGGGHRSGGDTITPVDALYRDELARIRAFLDFTVLACVALLAVLPVVGGQLAGKVTLAAAVGVTLCTSLWVRHSQRYSQRWVNVLAVLCSVAVLIGVYVWGVFSAGAAVVLLGIYFFSLGRSFLAALLIYLLCAGGYAVLATLLIAGVIGDEAIIGMAPVATRDLVLTTLLVEGFLLSTFLLARSSRRSALESLAQLARATRAVAHRDALLREVRQELERAMQVGGSGHYTERQIGDYKLGIVLGRGAMGELYEATHVETGESAAIKLLPRHLLGSRDNLTRFVREAEAVAALRAPNVVRVLEVSQPGAPIPYIAMERLHGNDLGHHLRVERRFPLRRVVDLAGQIGRGLDAVAAEGIVHRDISPQNIFFAEQEGADPVAKILDFGLSKLADNRGSLTRGRALGTPAYVAPEQARGLEVDQRADVCSLGAVLYRCLTGYPPFASDDLWAILNDVMTRMPTRPSEYVDVPEDVERVFAIALAKDPEDRFDRAGELADALVAAAREQLADDLRARADALLAHHPWGTAIVFAEAAVS